MKKRVVTVFVIIIVLLTVILYHGIEKGGKNVSSEGNYIILTHLEQTNAPGLFVAKFEMNCETILFTPF